MRMVLNVWIKHDIQKYLVNTKLTLRKMCNYDIHSTLLNTQHTNHIHTRREIYIYAKKCIYPKRKQFIMNTLSLKKISYGIMLLLLKSDTGKNTKSLTQ